LEDETRGIIEKTIDNVMKHEILQDIEWIQDVIPLTSFEDVVFGYAIGVLKQQIYTMLMSISGIKMIPEEDKREVDKILERRVPEIRQKIIEELGR